jgi:hypothetical protein
MLNVRSVQAQFVPRNDDIFDGLDVDKKSRAVIFTDHQQLMQSLRLPDSAAQLLSYVRKHFAEQRVALCLRSRAHRRILQ